MYTYRSDVLPNDQQHPQQRAHQVRRDSNTDTASTTSTDDSSSLSPPPPPPPRRSNDADQSPLRGPWVHFDSRNVSWASTFDNTSSSGSDDGSDAESSFQDNNETLADASSSPVVITASADGSGWEVHQPPTAAPAVHADHAAQIIGDRVRRMLQQKQNDDRTVHQKLTQQKQKRDEALRRKQLAVEEGISNDEDASRSPKYCSRAPSARTCLLSVIAVIFLLCGTLGIALVVVSKKGDSNNMSAFGELDIGHSGPPLDDAYDGGAGGPSDGAAGDGASGDDSNIIDEVGEEGYYNDEDDDGIPDGYEGYSGDEYDFIVT